MIRGGSWNNNPQNLRSAQRNRNTPDNRNNNLGFRVASTLISPEPHRPARCGRARGGPEPVLKSRAGQPPAASRLAGQRASVSRGGRRSGARAAPASNR
ncbi:MAG: hypothetical protein SGJ21_17275 [Alphaproteobacteria bacterium]|nr:hypothetical protein [Alphaproteobacteria bacterium]